MNPAIFTISNLTSAATLTGIEKVKKISKVILDISSILLFILFMNLNSIELLPTGKSLSKPQINLLTFMESVGVVLPENYESRSNPFTGVSHKLSPLACAIYDFIIGTRNSGFCPLTYNGKKIQVAQWDRARYLFLHLWPDQYYDLLD